VDVLFMLIAFFARCNGWAVTTSEYW